MPQTATLQKIFNLNYQTSNVRVFPRTLATTTEDDFIQDGKGVANKTKFTFSIVYTDPFGADSTSLSQAKHPRRCGLNECLYFSG
jgi:hypothetical protein